MRAAGPRASNGAGLEPAPQLLADPLAEGGGLAAEGTLNRSTEISPELLEEVPGDPARGLTTAAAAEATSAATPFCVAAGVPGGPGKCGGGHGERRAPGARAGLGGGLH
mmetsp:Transcript_118856/g.296462  ORF Transcript_118856/g.296462 Transcript_118856/m.296462 type:complete len:109 (-) Transcript_118856:3-329(-)